MADFTELVKLIRKIVKETTEANKPSGVYYGKVTSVSPIKIVIDASHVLTEAFIVLGRYITEFSTDLTIDGELWHGLRPNDELILMREQGGQKYIVTDWVKRVDEDTRPAWIKEGEVVSVSPLAIKVNTYLTLKEDQLILCHSVRDHLGYLSFDNPAIKQKISIWNAAEPEPPIPGTSGAGKEPHPPPPGDTTFVEQVTDIQFLAKQFAGDEKPLPAYHEVTLYNRFELGDKVLLACNRSLQKWFVVDFTHQVKQKEAWWIK